MATLDILKINRNLKDVCIKYMIIQDFGNNNSTGRKINFYFNTTERKE